MTIKNPVFSMSKSIKRAYFANRGKLKNKKLNAS
jgi:hypothetical protein